MITVPLINWQPMGTMPDDRKDGRDLLLWTEIDGATVGQWYDNSLSREPPEWVEKQELMPVEPTHWADINPPT